MNPENERTGAGAAQLDRDGPARDAPGEPVFTALVLAGSPEPRSGLRRLLDADPEIAVAAETSNGLEAVDLVAGLQPDIILLDAALPGIGGFQVAERLGRAGLPVVVFISSSKDDALRAFDFGAADFVLHSQGSARMRVALGRAKAEIRRREPGVGRVRPRPWRPLAGEARHRGRILLKASGEYVFLRPEEIRWIEADGDYVKFHVHGRHYLLRETMGSLESRLDSRRFARIHRSAIVNLDAVAKLSPTFAGEYCVLLEDGTRLRLSRRYDRRLQALMRTAL